jgi:hypothetical protein
MRVAFDAAAAGLISASQQAELHREIYAAIIKGCTRQRGARGRLAADAGITPQYLSYVLVADTDPRAPDVVALSLVMFGALDSVAQAERCAGE